MKKILPFLFIVILCFSLISCGKSIEEEVKTEVEVRISTYLKYTYGISEFPNFSSSVQQSKTDKNTFEVSGYFSVTDKYGNLYTGDYDGKVTYDPETEKLTIEDLEVSKLRLK